MNRAIVAYGMYQVLRVSLRTILDAALGRYDRETGDRRLKTLADKVIRRADIQLTVIGGRDVPSDGAFVYMSNHQSLFDIPILYASLPAHTLRMVAKTELFRIPIWGRAMRAGEMIEVDRSSRDKAIASLKNAQKLIHSGVSVWLAPEGTRSRTGEIAPLKKGGFHLARETGTAIIPVAINGTINVTPPEKFSVHKGVPVTVVIGSPIEVKGRELSAVMDEVERFLRQHVS